MPRFTYKAKDENGDVIEATAHAESKYALYRQRKQKGEQVIRAKSAEKKERWWTRLIASMRRVTTIKTKEKITFARNLGLMIDAGLSISRALSVLRRQASNMRLKDAIGDIEERIGAGNQLYEALQEHTDIFSPLFISMVKAGEEGGTLGNSLATISEQMQRADEVTKKVRGAMIYPAIIICIMVAIGVLAILYIVPTLQDTFEQMEVELPLSTRILIGTSEFLQNNWLITSALGIGVLAGAVAFFRSGPGKRTIDFILLHVPVISFMVKQVNSARTTRTLSSLLRAGVDYVQALAITTEVVQNSYYKDVLEEVQEEIQKGENLSTVLGRHEKLYPVFVSEMANVGEETGQLSDMLQNAAEYYEEEVRRKTDNLSTIIEPLLMVVMGLGVGLFAFAMLQPIYSLVDTL